MENENYYNSDFQHGYNTGLENGNRDKIDETSSAYEAYLSSQVSYDWIGERINEKKAEIHKIDAEIEQAKQTSQESYSKLQEHILGEKNYEHKRDLISQQIEDNRLKIDDLESRKKKNETPYSLFAGILYFLAGVAFVIGDLIISHEIVAYALNIRNNIEAWTFAVGLAMLSVLLKPAYERLVEQPYLTDYNPKTKRIYGIFQGFLLFFSISTMLVLGWFRYEAYKTDKLKEGINKQIKAMQLNSQPLDALGSQPTDNQQIIQQMDEKLKAYDKLNLDLVNSPWALLSFILSGVLFAIAGAICLGISFPILQSYWFKWLQANPAIKKARKQQIALNESLQIAEKELSDQTVWKNIMQNKLETLPNIEELKLERKAISKEIDALLDDLKQFDIDRRIHTFTDGFEKGQTNRIEMTDEEYEELRSSGVKQMKNLQDSKTDSGAKIYKTGGLRPHQALRKAITEQFNNQN